MRAFDAKHELSESIRLDAPLPGGRAYVKQPPGAHQRHRSQPPRGSAGRRRRGPPIDERQDVKYKLVKIGDNPERLANNVKDLARVLDAYVAIDRRQWVLPPLSVEEDEKFEELDGPRLLQQTVLSNLDALQPESNSAHFLDVLLECVCSLPHKHSYYASLWLVLLRESAGQNEMSSVIHRLYGSKTKTELTAFVKGEIIEEDTMGDNVIVKSDQGKQPLTKTELGAPHVVYNPSPDDVYFLFLFGCFMRRVEKSIQELLTRPEGGGYHQISRLTNLFRFLSDMVNVYVLDGPTHIENALKLVQQAADVLREAKEEGFSPSRRLAEVKTQIACQAMLFLSRAVYQAHSERFLEIGKCLEDIRSLRANEMAARCHSEHCLERNCENGVFVDFLSQLIDGYLSHLSRGWSSKVVPRLYDSPKLVEYRQQPLHLKIGLTFEPYFDLPVSHWPVFVRDPSQVWRDQEARNPSPVELFMAPPSLLFWREPKTSLVQWEIFTDRQVAAAMDVEPLDVGDVAITRQYVTDTVTQMFRDLDGCAEQLLYIPIKHDQFTFILIEQLFVLLLNYPQGPLSSWVQPHRSSVFLAQLLHRLCILERSLFKLIMSVLKTMLERVATWEESFFHRMASFAATWATFNEQNATCFCELVMEQPGFEPITAIQARDLPEKFGSHLGRFVSHVVSRISASTLPDVFEVLVHPQLASSIPQVSLNSFDEDVPFARHVNEVVRTEDDVPSMMAVRMDAKPCLEAIVLRRIMRLQVTGPREIKVIGDEVTNFLVSRLDRGFIADITDYSVDRLEAILYPEVRRTDGLSLKRDRDGEAMVKTIEEDDNDVSAKRQRVSEPPLVKAEIDGNENTLVEIKDVTVPAVVKHEEPMDEEEPIIDDGQIHDRLSKEPFRELPVSHFRWTYSTLTRLLVNVLVLIGSRTLSHSQKALDLYSRVLRNWKLAVAVGVKPSPEESYDANKKSICLVELSVLQCLTESWMNLSVPKMRYLLYQFIVMGVVDPVYIVEQLSRWPSPEAPLLHTVAGDYIGLPLLLESANIVNEDATSTAVDHQLKVEACVADETLIAHMPEEPKVQRIAAMLTSYMQGSQAIMTHVQPGTFAHDLASRRAQLAAELASRYTQEMMI